MFLKIKKSNKMKFKILIILSFVLSAFFTSCSSSDVTVIGNWVYKGHMESVARADGSSFAINNLGYYGMGFDGDYYLSDFWKYNPTTNVWSEVAKFPGTPRAYNISISNGVKGYVGLGYDGDVDLTDFWEYDPTTNTWDSLPPFPGGPRRMATAFAIGTDIYVGTGYNGDTKTYFNDIYKFSNGEWTKVSGFTGDKRYGAQSIGFNGKGYLISGNHSGLLYDFWEFDPSTGVWTEQYKLSDTDNGGNTAIARYNASAFVSESKIYLVGGTVNGSSLATCFEWDPTTLEWTEKTEIENSGSREGAGCFVLEDYGYLVGGRKSSLYLDDCWKFEPSIEKDTDDN
jgi:N-acetylneuraminic acid mutarotase